MKNKLLHIVTAVTLFSFPTLNFAQVAPNLGASANFALFSSDGAVTMNTSSFSFITGDIGTGNPATTSTGFGNVNGNQHDGDATGIAAAADLLSAYNQLNGMTANYFPATAILGNGDTLIKGIYKINSVGSLNLTLYLNAKGDPNAVFIFQIQGAFATTANAKVKLLNGALACNVFWKVEGKIDMATGTSMKGTMIANNDEIVMAVGDTLEGRAFSTTGAITVNGILASMPLGCGTPVLTGPSAPVLGAAGCFAVFSTNGAVSNSGVTKITGDIGSNGTSAPTGFVASDVTGTIHLVADATTAQCANDLATAYTYLNTLPIDIELKFPAQFGNNLILTPHTYLLNAATTLTDTVVLNAEGNTNAIFVIKINGALSTSVNARVKLINGTQVNNVYWKIEGAVGINDNSTFVGTIVVNNGALGALNTGVRLNGRALTTGGALTTTALTVVAGAIPVNGCGNGTVDVQSSDVSNSMVIIYPNPITSSTTLLINGVSLTNNCELTMYNALGIKVIHTQVTKQATTLGIDVPSGIYFYKVIANEKVIQSGKLISQ